MQTKDAVSQDLVRAEVPIALAKSPRDIKALISGPEFKAAVASVLPRAMRPDRFVRVSLNAVMRQPKLLECSKESFFRVMLDLSAYGLEPDGRRAHLIPFTNHGKMEVQLIIDYKGLAELVRRSGDVSYIHADVVYENDEWDYAYGSGAHLTHRPNLEERGEKRVAFYSFVRLKDGSEDFIVMSPAEVEKIKKRSRAAGSGPWVTDYDEMGKKTAFRRHSKWLPLSPEVREAVEADDEAIDVSGIAMAETMQTGVSLDSFVPSADENRGHDGAAPKANVKGRGPDPASCYVTFDAIQDCGDFGKEHVWVGGAEYRFVDGNYQQV